MARAVGSESERDGSSAADRDSSRESCSEGVVCDLLTVADLVCKPQSSTVQKKQALWYLTVHLQPNKLHHEDRRKFVECARAKGIIKATVELIEVGTSALACAAANFLGDFIFNSDAGAREVLELFDQIAGRFVHIFTGLAQEHLALLEAAVKLCVNIAAVCTSGHPRLIPLVQPVCLQIISNPKISDNLRSITILLLANLSLTSASPLRALGVGEALLDLVSAERQSECGKSVAESVIIFLHGDHKCREVDELMARDVIVRYCIPLLERTLLGEEFRGMYPHLLYTARLFQVLAQSEEYAKALAANPDVIPLLLRVNNCTPKMNPRVETDLEGRRLALEALRSLVRFRLWPRRLASASTSDCSPTEESITGTSGSNGQADDDTQTKRFLERTLPLLLDDGSAGLRASAAELWACVNISHLSLLLLVGSRLESRGSLPYSVWKARVLSCLVPSCARGL